MGDVAGWIAPCATAIAAVMTASNLGARVTGWGFVVFVVGSVAWCTVALTTDQLNLLWANGFLTVVNLFGVWRWLGCQARYERGAQHASLRSRRSRSPDLISFSSLIGADITGPDGTVMGRIAEVMIRCEDLGPAYVVAAIGGVGGVGETLHALMAAEFEMCGDRLRSLITLTELAEREPLAASAWPVTT